MPERFFRGPARSGRCFFAAALLLSLGTVFLLVSLDRTARGERIPALTELAVGLAALAVGLGYRRRERAAHHEHPGSGARQG